MSSYQGTFVWYELMTSDPTAAGQFYGAVLGWEGVDSGLPDRSYTILSMKEAPVGGLMPIPAEACAAGARPCWTGYIGVDDVDGMAQRITAAGGNTHHAPENIPGVGRFAVMADPQGSAFALFTPQAGEARPAIAPGTPGHVGWRELHAQEWQDAFGFYSGLFGWTKAEAVDMGPMGTYQLFAGGGTPMGGMMNKGEAQGRPSWLYYFNVDDIDAAVARVKERGGEVQLAPQQVPGGAWIAQCLDPQQARFAMVGPRH
jgi:hypothetical protein